MIVPLAQHVVPVPAVSVPGYREASIVFRVTRRVALRYLVVARSCAEEFEIVDIKMGKNCQFLSGAGVSVEIFAGESKVLETHDSSSIVALDQACPMQVAFATVGPEDDIVVRVRNVAGYEAFFMATFLARLMSPTQCWIRA